MSETQESPRRRASDKIDRQRLVTGWIGVMLGVVICLVGLARENDFMVYAAVAVIWYSGNRLPYKALERFIPTWGSKS